MGGDPLVFTWIQLSGTGAGGLVLLTGHSAEIVLSRTPAIAGFEELAPAPASPRMRAQVGELAPDSSQWQNAESQAMGKSHGETAAHYVAGVSCFARVALWAAASRSAVGKGPPRKPSVCDGSVAA